MGMKLPTRAELAQLASVVYGATIGEKQYYCGEPLEEYRSAITIGFGYWSSEQPTSNPDSAYYRGFGYIGTSSDDSEFGKKYYSNWAICIGS